MSKKNGFSKQQFLKSSKFTPIHKDVLSALLKDGEKYTMDEAEKMINQFLKKEAK